VRDFFNYQEKQWIIMASVLNAEPTGMPAQSQKKTENITHRHIGLVG
jgi:hypothetical protein